MDLAGVLFNLPLPSRQTCFSLARSCSHFHRFGLTLLMFPWVVQTDVLFWAVGGGGPCGGQRGALRPLGRAAVMKLMKLVDSWKVGEDGAPDSALGAFVGTNFPRFPFRVLGHTG